MPVPTSHHSVHQKGRPYLQNKHQICLYRSCFLEYCFFVMSVVCVLSCYPMRSFYFLHGRHNSDGKDCSLSSHPISLSYYFFSVRFSMIFKTDVKINSS